VILGLVLSYVSGYEGSALAPLAAVVVLVATLMIRPSGIFSSARERRV
jgi:branched-chain amino acid transport system permease protein